MSLKINTEVGTLITPSGRRLHLQACQLPVTTSLPGIYHSINGSSSRNQSLINVVWVFWEPTIVPVPFSIVSVQGILRNPLK